MNIYLENKTLNIRLNFQMDVALSISHDNRLWMYPVVWMIMVSQWVEITSKNGSLA